MSIQEIPSDIIIHQIFTFLNSIDLFHGCILVCKKWYELVWKSPKKFLKIHNPSNNKVNKLALLIGLGRFNHVKGFHLYYFDCSMLGSLLASKQICKNVEKLIIDGQDGNSIGKEGAMLIGKRNFPNLKYLSLMELSNPGISIILRSDNFKKVEELRIENGRTCARYHSFLDADKVRKQIQLAKFPNLRILNGVNLNEIPKFEDL